MLGSFWYRTCKLMKHVPPIINTSYKLSSQIKKNTQLIECKVGGKGGRLGEFEKSYKSYNPCQLFPLGSWERSTKGAHHYRLYTIN